jgi:hypothetical protein
MRKFLAGLFFLTIAQAALAQSSADGTISDTLGKKNLTNAVVSLLQKKDSTLYKFTRTGTNGTFHFPNVKPGKYILLVSYPRFADFSDDVEIKDQPQNHLGSIPLTLKSQLLDAVVIRSAGAIRIKGDTTEFVADSFHVKEGATVEELLKKLPGFQVNSKGQITAQGQKVGKVLVDGEEFFGDDPTMATQNIAAKAVDKVQVFDTKTEQQNLTGISTGNEGKTVNIKLKEDAKKGAFGKSHFGTDFNRLIDAKALYNRFSGKKKISLYGTKSDISTGSLNWEDRQKLGMENDFEYDEISGYYFSFGSDDGFNDWSLRGLPNSYTAGGLFSNKWNEDKNSFNTSYRYNRLGTVNEASTFTQNILSSGTTYQNKFQNSSGLNQQHSVNGKYEWKFDSLASLKFTTTGTFKKTDALNKINSEYQSGEFTNKSNQLQDNHTEKIQNDNQLVYRQQFKKKDRLMITTLRFGIIEDKQNGVIQTHTDFYENGTLDSVDIADQQKRMTGNSKTLGAKTTWSEPLSMKWSLVVEYAFNKNNSGSHRNTYNKDATGKYATLDQEFSNNFDLNVFSHSGTTIFKYADKKLRAAFGSGISSVKLKLYNLDENNRNHYNFLNLTPQASVNYTLKPQTNLRFNYRGTTRQPTIDQLQPIRDNTNRLNIFIGNPDLKVGFNHSFNIGFNTYKTLSQKGLFTNFGYNIPVNAITFLTSVDVSRGKQTYTPVNVNGSRNWYFYADYFKDGGEKKLGYSFNMRGNGGKNINFISEDGVVKKNATSYMNSDLGFALRYNNPDKFSFEINPRGGYNVSGSSLNPQLKNNYWNYGGGVETTVTLPGKFELSSSCNFDLRQNLAAFAGNPNQIIWNASLSKKVFKDKSGKIYFIANDLLDRNKGFNRNISSNFISEDRYSRISRYFLLKFEWSLSKMPGQNK